MSKIVIALLVLVFCFLFLLFMWILFLSLALLLFSRKGKNEIKPLSEAKGDKAGVENAVEGLKEIENRSEGAGLLEGN